MSDCIFCRIAAGRGTASIVAEMEAALAFMTLEQPTPYKVIVVPRAHVATIYDLTDAQAAAVFQLAVRVARAIRRVSGCAGLNLVQSNGTAAGQDVFHVHLHLVPRFPNDGITLDWDNTVRPRAYLDRLAAELREGLEAIEP